MPNLHTLVHDAINEAYPGRSFGNLICIPRESVDVFYSNCANSRSVFTGNIAPLMMEGLLRHALQVTHNDITYYVIVNNDSGCYGSPGFYMRYLTNNLLRVDAVTRINDVTIYKFFPDFDTAACHAVRILGRHERKVIGHGDPMTTPNSMLAGMVGVSPLSEGRIMNLFYPQAISRQASPALYDYDGDWFGTQSISSCKLNVIGGVPILPSMERNDRVERNCMVYDPHGPDHSQWFSQFGEIRETRRIGDYTLSKPVYCIKLREQYLQDVIAVGGKVYRAENGDVLYIMYGLQLYIPYILYYNVFIEHTKIINQLMTRGRLDMNSNTPHISDDVMNDPSIRYPNRDELIKGLANKYDTRLNNAREMISMLNYDINSNAARGVQYKRSLDQYKAEADILKAALENQKTKANEQLQAIANMPEIYKIHASNKLRFVLNEMEARILVHNKVVATYTTPKLIVEFMRSDNILYDLKVIGNYCDVDGEPLYAHPYVDGNMNTQLPSKYVIPFMDAMARNDYRTMVNIIVQALKRIEVQPQGYEYERAMKYVGAKHSLD